MDSIAAVFSQFSDPTVVRREITRIALELKDMGGTAVITGERAEDHGPLGRYGIEEFAADDVVILRNGSSDARITSGNAELDRLCGGGLFRNSITLVSGATGTGKTLTVSQFLGAADREDRALLFAFEESCEQLFRNARGWGFDLEAMERDGRLRVICEYPEVRGLEDHLIRIKAEMDAFRPTRVAIDSLSALERVGTTRAFREFAVGLTAFIKQKSAAAVITLTSPTLLGGTTETEGHISTLTDAIVLLRYVEMHGRITRGIAVLKMRGSPHDKEIHEFDIDGHGMHIGEPFRDVTGLLTGTPRQARHEPIT